MMTFGRLLGGVGVSGAGSLRHAFDADSAPEFSTPCNPCGGAANLVASLMPPTPSSDSSIVSLGCPSKNIWEGLDAVLHEGRFDAPG